MADSRLDIGSFHAHQGEETPRVFFAHGEKITVMKILKTWGEECGPGRTRRFYSVEGSDGFVHTLYHDPETDGWFYRGFERNRNR